ncbi:MAG: NAD-dependent deacylase [Sandaracinaceae bacterium]|nr:NAD-dependent deacylase [Sandaracinaceae bacterium]
MSDPICELADRLREARHAVALTGAGVSTDSGIPDFRSARSGLWQKHDPMKVASIEGFRREPRAFYDFWGERFAGLDAAKPNVSHEVLARAEARSWLRAVVTQNIDGLHQKAGSREVLEVHGTYSRTRCLGCDATGTLVEVARRVKQGRLPICEDCGELVKPDVVLFGEELPSAFERARTLVRASDLLVVLGSSLEVHPVASLVPEAKTHGATIIIADRGETEMDDLADVIVRGELSRTMPRLAERLGID